MGVVALARLAKGKSEGPDGTLATLALELIGTIIFLASRDVGDVFSAFVPRSFDCGGGECDQPQTFLAADLGVEYHSEEHAFWQLYAWLMIAIWPLGVPLLHDPHVLAQPEGPRGAEQPADLVRRAALKIDERSGG